MWNSSHWKLTGGCQSGCKESYIKNQVGNEEKQSRVPGGDSEEREITWAETIPGE